MPSDTPRKGRKPRTAESVRAFAVYQLLNNYVIDENGCWLWTGLFYSSGYGRLRRNLTRSGLAGRAHMAAYQFYVGEIPAGLYVCHTCDVRRCINPEHLWLGTNQENQLDASRKGVFKRYWTPEVREAKRKEMSGVGNHQYGKRGSLATCYGRCGPLHPMYGRKQTEDAKQKISAGLKRAHSEGRR